MCGAVFSFSFSFLAFSLRQTQIDAQYVLKQFSRQPKKHVVDAESSDLLKETEPNVAPRVFLSDEITLSECTWLFCSFGDFAVWYSIKLFLFYLKYLFNNSMLNWITPDCLIIFTFIYFLWNFWYLYNVTHWFTSTL